MITIKRARKILGQKYKNHTDEEIEKLITHLTYICNKVIDDVVKK